MPNTIGTAYIQIEPTTQGISGSIGKVLEGDASTAGKNAGNKFSGAFGTAAKGMVGGVAALGAAGIATAGALYSTASATAEAGDNIDKMSQKLGVSSTFYQEWDAVLQHSGTSMDAQSATFKKLANAAQDASADQVKAFEAIGLSMEDVQSMSTEDLFTSVITGLQGMEEGTERTALATDLLGKGAMEMGALLNTSAEDTQGMINTVHELGGVMSEDAVKNAAAFQDSLQDLQTSLGGVMNSAMAELLPSFTQIMDGFTGLVTGSEDAKEKLSAGFASLAESAAQAIPALVEGLVTGASAIAEVAPQLITTLVNSLVDNLPQLVVAAVQIMLSLGVALVQALPNLISAIPQIVVGIVKAFIQAAPMLKEAGTKLIDTLKMAIQTAWNAVTALASTLMSRLKEAFMQKVQQFADIGKNIVEGIKNGIANGWDNLKNYVKDLANSLLDSAKDALGIHSPSRLFANEVGKWIPAGIAKGINNGMGVLNDAIENMTEGALEGTLRTGFTAQIGGATLGNLSSGYNTGIVGGYNQTINVYSPEALSAAEVARQTRNSTRNMVLALRGV